MTFARAGARTPDPGLIRPMLYRLSYTSIPPHKLFLHSIIFRVVFILFFLDKNKMINTYKV